MLSLLVISFPFGEISDDIVFKNPEGVLYYKSG
jgi:hypothetical protein